MSKKHFYALTLCCTPFLVSASSTSYDGAFESRPTAKQAEISSGSAAPEADQVTQLATYRALLEQDYEALEAYLSLPSQYQEDANLAHLLDASEVLAGLSKFLTPQCISFLASLGWEQAMDIKVEGLFGGVYGFKKNPDAARMYIDRQMCFMPRWAINKRITGWQQGIYGFEQNDTALKQEIERAISQGFGSSIPHIARYWSFGTHGFEMDLNQAKKHVESALEAGEPWALDFTMRGLKDGDFGYEPAPHLVQALLQSQVETFKEAAEIRQYQELKAEYFVARPEQKSKKLDATLFFLDAALAANKPWAYHHLGIEFVQPTFIEELDLIVPHLCQKTMLELLGNAHLVSHFKEIPSDLKLGFVCLLMAARMGFNSSWSDLFDVFPKHRQLLIPLIAEHCKLPVNELFAREKSHFDEW
ncbi:MAG: hypothetical protein ACK5O7_03425 [Holosporales bacterium]